MAAPEHPLLRAARAQQEQRELQYWEEHYGPNRNTSNPSNSGSNPQADGLAFSGVGNGVDRARIFAVLDDLVRLVCMAFYSAQHLAVLAPILKLHRECSDDDLSRILKLPSSQIRSFLGDLLAGGLLSSVERRIRMRVLTQEEIARAEQDAKPGSEPVSRVVYELGGIVGQDGDAGDDPDDGEVAPVATGHVQKNAKQEQIKGRRARARQRSFWFVDYARFLDVVRFRLKEVADRLRARAPNGANNPPNDVSGGGADGGLGLGPGLGPGSASGGDGGGGNGGDSGEEYDYECPGCQKTFTTLEAADLLDIATSTMLCNTCGTEVRESDHGAAAVTAQSRLMLFNEQLAPILSQLQKAAKLAEDSRIPEIDHRVHDVLVDEEDNHVGMAVAVGRNGVLGGKRSTADYGFDDGSAGPGEISVRLTDASDGLDSQPVKKKQKIAWLESAGDRAREEEREAVLAAQQAAKARLEATGAASFAASLGNDEDSLIDIDGCDSQHDGFGDSSAVSAATELDGSLGPTFGGGGGPVVKMEESPESTSALLGTAAVFVSVAGEPVRLEDVTEDHQHRMTEDEYADFEEKYALHYGGDAEAEVDDGEESPDDSLM
jgi:transcription initiation factor IIE alpha subunit